MGLHVHVHGSSRYTVQSIGVVNAFCVRCNAITVQQRQELREGAELNRLPVFSVRAGVEFVCSVCKRVRCGDRRGDPGGAARRRYAIQTADEHPQAVELPEDEIDRKLVGLSARFESGELTSDDRVFLLTEYMREFWQTRLSHQRGLRFSLRSLYPLAGLALAGTAATAAARFGPPSLALQIVVWCLGVLAFVFLIRWIRCLAGLDRHTVETELRPLVEGANQINAAFEEIAAAHAAVKACGFQFMNLAKPRRIWRLMFHDLTRRTAAALNATVE